MFVYIVYREDIFFVGFFFSENIFEIHVRKQCQWLNIPSYRRNNQYTYIYNIWDENNIKRNSQQQNIKDLKTRKKKIERKKHFLSGVHWCGCGDKTHHIVVIIVINNIDIGIIQICTHFADNNDGWLRFNSVLALGLLSLLLVVLWSGVAAVLL